MSSWEESGFLCESWVKLVFMMHGEKNNNTGRKMVKLLDNIPPRYGVGLNLVWNRFLLLVCMWFQLVKSCFKYISDVAFRYFLQPRENGGKSVKVEELGSLRLNIVYTEDHVFPSEYYTPLRDLLLHSANVEVQRVGVQLAQTSICCDSNVTSLHVQPVSASTAHILGEVCREKQEAAVPLVRLFLHCGKIVPFISAIAHTEVNRTQ